MPKPRVTFLRTQHRGTHHLEWQTVRRAVAREVLAAEDLAGILAWFAL
jgi:hypothetical protein